MVVMKSAVTNSFSVEMLQENASPRGGNATTTKIVKMARTNMTVVSTHYSFMVIWVLELSNGRYKIRKVFCIRINTLKGNY